MFKMQSSFFFSTMKEFYCFDAFPILSAHQNRSGRILSLSRASVGSSKGCITPVYKVGRALPAFGPTPGPTALRLLWQLCNT